MKPENLIQIQEKRIALKAINKELTDLLNKEKKRLHEMVLTGAESQIKELSEKVTYLDVAIDYVKIATDFLADLK